MGQQGRPFLAHSGQSPRVEHNIIRTDLYDTGRRRLTQLSNPVKVSRDDTVGRRGTMNQSILTPKDILRDPKGTKRSEAAVANLYGVKALHLALIAEQLVKLRRLPVRLSEPPHVFVSYAWGTPNENEWVTQLARSIRERGYIVHHDRSRKQRSVTTRDIATIVAEIAPCHMFVCVIDPRYIDQVGDRVTQATSMRWAHTEFMFAMATPLPLTIVGLLRSGRAVPPGMSIADEYRAGSVRDVRDPAQLAPALDVMVPRRPAPPNRGQVRRSEELLKRVTSSLRKNKHNRVLHASKSLVEILPTIADGHELLALAGLRENQLELAYNEGVALFNINSHRVQNRIVVAAAALEFGRPDQALRIMCTDRSGPSGIASLIVGASLLELGQGISAHAHVQLATRRRKLDVMCKQLLDHLGREGALNNVSGGPRVTSPHKIPTSVFGPANHIVQIPNHISKPGGRTQPILLNMIADLPGMQLGREFEVVLLARLAPRVAALWSPRLPERKFSPTVVECRHCKFLLQVTDYDHAICDGCGAQTTFSERTNSHCAYCGSGAVTSLPPAFAGGRCRCPYCRDGDLYGDRVGLVVLELRREGKKTAVLKEAADLLETWVEAHETAAHAPLVDPFGRAAPGPSNVQRAHETFGALERFLATQSDPRLEPARKEIDRMFRMIFPTGGNPYRP